MKENTQEKNISFAEFRRLGYMKLVFEQKMLSGKVKEKTVLRNQTQEYPRNTVITGQAALSYGS